MDKWEKKEKVDVINRKLDKIPQQINRRDVPPSVRREMLLDVWRILDEVKQQLKELVA